MNPTPALAVVLLQLGAIVDRFECEHIAEEELERAEDERFELAGAEEPVCPEFRLDPANGRGVAEPAIEFSERLPHEPSMGDPEGGRHALQGAAMPLHSGQAR